MVKKSSAKKAGNIPIPELSEEDFSEESLKSILSLAKTEKERAILSALINRAKSDSEEGADKFNLSEKASELIAEIIPIIDLPKGMILQPSVQSSATWQYYEKVLARDPQMAAEILEELDEVLRESIEKAAANSHRAIKLKTIGIFTALDRSVKLLSANNLIDQFKSDLAKELDE